ncbi:MAG: NUDIX domain-containing protein [Anaerolineales bacterium]|nr:NUDIX domain-containing protein [Anaerolineales bacterium]MCA9927923.1 NUDIX domain-containing protein [Anaerolineales bacterium]
MKTIDCYDLQGNPTPVSPDNLLFRPAVYGIFIENQQVLLIKHPITGLWQPPGGILKANEPPRQAVRHFFRDVAGMTPDLGPLLHVEDAYRIDEQGQAWHLTIMYYALERPQATVATLTEIESAVQPDWVPLSECRREQFQLGYEAIEAGKLRTQI